MVTDQQVKRLRKFYQATGRLVVAAAKAGMSEKTARKYLRSRELPSELGIEGSDLSNAVMCHKSAEPNRHAGIGFQVRVGGWLGPPWHANDVDSGA